MASVAVVQAALRLDAQQFTKTIEQAKQDVAKFASSGKAIAGGVGAGLLSASVGLGALALNLKAAGDEADAIGDSLAQAFTGLELDRVTKQVLELGAQGVFTEQAFAGVAKRLGAFGKDASGSLQLLADVASKVGAPLDAVGEAYAKFGRDEKSTQKLLKLTGIRPDELVAYGAVLDSTTGKLSITGDNADKLVSAFDALAQSDRFAGAMAAGTDGASQLTAELKLLKAEIGAGLVTLFEDAGSAILPVAQYLRSFSDETKKLVGFGVLAGAIATGLGGIGIAGALAANAMAGAVAAAGGLAGFFGPLVGVLTTMATTALPAVTIGLTALTTVFNPLTLIVLGLAAATKAYIDTLADAAKAAEDLFQIEEKRAAAARTAEQFIGKSAEDLSKAGKTAKDVAAVADGLADRAQQAYETGNDALFQRLKRQVADLRSVQRELAVLEADKRETAAIQADVRTALGPAPDAAALAAQAKVEDDARKNREAADAKADEERTKKEKEAHEKRVKAKQDALNKAAKLDIQANYPVAKAAEDLTNKLKAENDKRLKDQADAAKAAADIAKQQASDLADAQEKGRNLQQQEQGNKVSDLQANTDQTGADNSAAIKQALLERLRLQQESIRLDAEKAKAATDSADARVQIERNAELEIQQAYRETKQELDANLKDQADSIKAFRDSQKKEGGVGDVLSLDQFFASSKLGYGIGRSRGDANVSASPLPNLQSVIQPLPNAVSANPSFDKLSSAADVLFSAAKTLNAAAGKETKVTLTTAPGSAPREATSGDGRQSSLTATARSIRRR